MKTTMMAVTALMMCASMPAWAADMEKKAEMKADYYFKKIDTNSDGKISMDEHEAFGKSMFKDADKNGDGMISMQEMRDEKMKEMTEMKSHMGDKSSMMMKKDESKSM